MNEFKTTERNRESSKLKIVYYKITPENTIETTPEDNGTPKKESTSICGCNKQQSPAIPA
jgi:hypothetical protein